MQSQSSTDVIVIGAGIQGVGVAQALAAAGRRVILLESHSPAAGTSSRSSKLIHGGLRYLETMQFGLVFESLAERATLLRIAPHLVRLVPFHIPVYRSTSRRPRTIRAGLSLYALLGKLRQDTRFSTIPKQAWPLLDGLRTDGLQAVFRYHDGQTDDAALCRAVLASAKELGAICQLETEMVAARRETDHWVVSYRDGSEVKEHTAKALVNATGPWAHSVLDRIRPTQLGPEIDLVAGTHIELSGCPEQGIYYTENPTDQRAVFSMPWHGHTLVGTTEQPYKGDPRAIAPTPEEIQYLLDTQRHYFPAWDGEVLDSWAGLRVLPRGTGRAFNRTREVTLACDDAAKPSLITLYGGKLTGYRATAEKVERRLRPTLGKLERVADTRTLRLPELS
ncbi:MAG: glycerol-3-phosphate dehydrogenase [Planctomycetota bacterium]|jgi:glycerol-3-phosphate dehydrogenase